MTIHRLSPLFISLPLIGGQLTCAHYDVKRPNINKDKHTGPQLKSLKNGEWEIRDGR